MPRQSGYIPSTEEVERELELLNHPEWAGATGVVGALLEALRATASDADLRSVHGALLGELKRREAAIVDVRARLKAARARRGALARERPKPTDAVRAAQKEITSLEGDERLQLAVHAILLDVGDAMAWRRLGYDRAAITALAQGPVICWLSDGRGWASELRALEEVWQDGALAFINDATTCLRHGDITCFFADRTELREVKAGRAADPDSPQMRRLATVVEFINARAIDVDGVHRLLVRSPRPYATHLNQLTGILDSARATGRDGRRVSPAQYVLVRSLLQDGGAPPFDDEQARAAAGWRRDDVVLRWGTTFRRMRDRHTHVSFVAPLSLLPVPIDLLVWVLFGALDVTTWVNVSAVCRALRLRGYYAEPLGPPESTDGFLRAGVATGATMRWLTLAPHLREAMALELMSTATVIALVDTAFASTRIEAGHDEQPLLVPSDEARVWELSPPPV